MKSQKDLEFGQLHEQIKKWKKLAENKPKSELGVGET